MIMMATGVGEWLIVPWVIFNIAHNHTILDNVCY